MISNIRGDFGAVTGTVDYDGKDITKAKVNATIDVKSISTRVEKRDEHLKTDDFLDVANHPTMTFVSTSITPAAGGKYNMTGNLTIRGTTKPVTFELTAPSGPITTRGTTKIGASASGKINRKDFGVKYHEVMDNGGLGVADEVFITARRRTDPASATHVEQLTSILAAARRAGHGGLPVSAHRRTASRRRGRTSGPS